MSFSLKQLQEEMKEWQDHNFPDRQSWTPLMGMVEEFGEILEEKPLIPAILNYNQLDGVADMLIFLSDYCNAKGFSYQELWDGRKPEKEYLVVLPDSVPTISILLGRLCHSHIKCEQGIRASEEQHLEDLKRNIQFLIYELIRLVPGEQNTLKLMEEVWSKVKQRDWKKNPLGEK